MDRNDDRNIPRDTDESESEARRTDARPADARPDARTLDESAEPPYTTRGKITSPKFGSAGSGGLEYEGNFDRD